MHNRSGTFASLVIAKRLKLRTLSSLVDALVDARRSRDGLVETPRQFNYLAHALGLATANNNGDSSGIARTTVHGTTDIRLPVAVIACWAVANLILVICSVLLLFKLSCRRQSRSLEKRSLLAEKSDKSSE